MLNYVYATVGGAAVVVVEHGEARDWLTSENNF